MSLLKTPELLSKGHSKLPEKRLEAILAKLGLNGLGSFC
jgi:hypothetical protein